MSNDNGQQTSTPTIDFSKYASASPQIDFSKYEGASPRGAGAAGLGLTPEDIGTGPEGTTPELMSKASQADATSKGLSVAGGIASAATGGVGGPFTQAAIQGGIGAATGAASTAAQDNSTQEDIINSALLGGGLGALSGFAGRLPGWLANTKVGRSFINESVGATGRDVIYGNPARALLDEGILTPATGDIEAMKATGKIVDAGGRLGQVGSRIQELQPQLNAALSKSTKTISMADAVDKPLMDAFNEIINNNAMTMPESRPP
jgi:hypothetical protein